MDTTQLPHDLLGLSTLVLLLGLRHGFDADHLAAVDALTRHHLTRDDPRARGIGALFSLGHGAVVVVAALAVSLVSSRWQVPDWLTAFGAWVSIGTLLALALLNIASLRCTLPHEHARPVGLRGRWFARLVALAGDGPVAAAGLGALFALSFDTLSLAALVAVSASQFGGWQGALQCALLFTAGMLVTDGLNGWWVSALLRRSDQAALVASRCMGWAVVAVSLFTAGLGLVGRLSNHGLDLPELLPGALVVGSLLLAFALAGRAAPTPVARAHV